MTHAYPWKGVQPFRKVLLQFFINTCKIMNHSSLSLLDITYLSPNLLLNSWLTPGVLQAPSRLLPIYTILLIINALTGDVCKVLGFTCVGCIFGVRRWCIQKAQKAEPHLVSRRTSEVIIREIWRHIRSTRRSITHMYGTEVVGANCRGGSDVANWWANRRG